MRQFGTRTGPLSGMAARSESRLAWFDYAKGICIILVVMMHSTLGVGEAFGGEGWLHLVVAYAKPFRMPDFFLLSGLFLAFAIKRNWLHYLDLKLVHFAYFYLLWGTLQIIVKGAGTGQLGPEFFLTQVIGMLGEAYPTLWFIYVLPIYFIVTKLAYGLPGIVLLGLAALIHILVPHTGMHTIDAACQYYVFFVAGYLFAPYVFELARWSGDNARLAVAAFVAWAVFNGLVVFMPDPIGIGRQLFEVPGLDIAIGLVGAGAIVMLAAVLERYDLASALRYCGKNSIVLYVAFTIPMAITRTILLKTGVIDDIGLVSLIVTAVAVIAPLALFAITRRTPFRYLFQRPEMFKLVSGKTASQTGPQAGPQTGPQSGPVPQRVYFSTSGRRAAT